jgi:hypothetical protein
MSGAVPGLVGMLLGVKENSDYIMSMYLTSQALLSNVQGGLWAQSVKILEF